MDVQRGHCWRCEKRLDGSPVYCKYCWIAVYCSQVCCVSDVFRHSVPECEEWGHKQCSNSGCEEMGPARLFHECSGCIGTWYCGNKCQRGDWQNHARSCKSHADEVQARATQMRESLESKRRKPMAQPYYIGNTIAIDMLNLQNNECNALEESVHSESGTHPALTKDYSILSVGCGNLRNFIHTLTCLPRKFRGKLHTTLNDFDPFVQARNVLFLYMMIAFGNKTDIGAILTTIWYSLHISKDHYEFVISCLKNLSQMTSESLGQATRDIIDISAGDLNLIKKVWGKWIELECFSQHSESINLKMQRRRWIESNYATALLSAYEEELNTKDCTSFEEWLEDGIFVETAEARKQYLEFENPTLTGFMFFNDDCSRKALDDAVFEHPEQFDFVYCVTPDLHPFGSWDHLLVRKFSKTASLIDMYHRYISDQIQQAVVRLTNSTQSVLFVVTECLDLEKRVPQPKCDRIFTSNVNDLVGTYKLLIAFKHYLNTENRFATLVTQHTGRSDFANPLLSRESAYPCLLYEPNSIHRKLTFRAALDMGKTIILAAPAFYLEYIYDIGGFVTFLQDEFLACNPQNSIPTFQDIKNSWGAGLRMRDFRRGLNQVVPFRYRRNVRHVNMLTEQETRTLEWYIP